MSDIAAALTGSLSRDGSGSMRANLPMGNHRITGLAAAVDPTDAVTLGQISGSSGVPVGAVIDFAGSAAPAGWLICAGQSLSRSDYPDLFTAIGTTYGAPDGASFKLPDCRGRVVAGVDVDNGGLAGRLTSATMTPDGATAGAVGGAETVALTVAQIPAHTHNLSGTVGPAGAHVHSMNLGNKSGLAGGGSQTAVAGGTGYFTSSVGDHTHALSGTADSTGGGGAHSNVQPTILMNKIIKATANG